VSIVETAARLARERLAPRAAEYDRDAKNPVDSWRDLWRHGLLGATIPRAHCGRGLDMPTYIGVVRALAGGCASTAMTLHMHSTVMRFVDTLGTEAQKRRYFPEVVTHGKLFGSWGSWVIDGVKHFCTMALGAYRDFPAERAFRDMRTATLMPPTADRMLETIGTSVLGLTEAMFRVSGGAPGA